MEESNQVITKKNEGRVAASKRLAEWNRKNKADLQKNMGKSSSSDDQEPASGPHKSMDNVYLYGVGTLAVLAIGVGVWYKFAGKNGGESHKPTPEPQQKDKPHPAIFKMH